MKQINLIVNICQCSYSSRCNGIFEFALIENTGAHRILVGCLCHVKRDILYVAIIVFNSDNFLRVFIQPRLVKDSFDERHVKLKFFSCLDEEHVNLKSLLPSASFLLNFKDTDQLKEILLLDKVARL